MLGCFCRFNGLYIYLKLWSLIQKDMLTNFAKSKVSSSSKPMSSSKPKKKVPLWEKRKWKLTPKETKNEFLLRGLLF